VRVPSHFKRSVTTNETVNWDVTSQYATEQVAVSRKTQYYPSYTLTVRNFYKLV